MSELHPVVEKVTRRIIERSLPRRRKYLDLIERGREAEYRHRHRL
jgi:phosphogluconate dehydratase